MRPGPPLAAALLALAAGFAALPAAAAADVSPPELRAPSLWTPHLALVARGAGAAAGSEVALLVERGGRSREVAHATAGGDGAFELRWTPRERGRYRLLATGAGLSSAPASVFVREVTLAAVGDVNLGDGVARVMRSRGRAYPWRHVGRALRAADLTFGNLECAVSRRGHALPKAFTFRGSPGALAVARRKAGFDAMSVANNHAGDFGGGVFADTLRNLRRRGIAAVGGGFDYHQAHRARILVRRDVRRARHRADVVVVSFHWGVERSTRPNRRQHALARAVLGAGADAVIGHHPHVQQPVRRAGGHRLVAWSLGNFVFVPGGPRTITGRTRILKLRLSGRGVEGFSQRRYRIHSGQPR